MAPMYILARDIKTRNTTAAMRLCLVRTYDILQIRYSEKIKSRECVFHDEEGSYVHFHISGNNVSVSNEFIEGHVYFIKNFLMLLVVWCKSSHHKLIKGRPSKLIDFVIEDLNLCNELTPLKSMTSNSSFSYGTYSLGDQSNSNMVINTISDLFDRSEVATKIPKEIESLVGRGLLFKINVKRDQLDKRNLAFPVMQIKEDIAVLNQYCPGLLKDKKQKGTDSVDPMEDDLDSDEVESPFPNALKVGIVGGNESEAVKRRLLDEFSSTQCPKKKTHTAIIKLEKDNESAGDRNSKN
nr:putative transposase [Ipomoea batatas]